MAQVSETLKDPRWKAAMIEEMHTLDKNKTCDIVDLSEGKRAVGCKKVYTLKYNLDGKFSGIKQSKRQNGFT